MELYTRNTFKHDKKANRDFRRVGQLISDASASNMEKYASGNHGSQKQMMSVFKENMFLNVLKITSAAF